MYLLFCGDWQEGGDFRDDGLAGIERFLSRIRRLIIEPQPSQPPPDAPTDLRELDRGIAAVTHDVEWLKFNTAISALMSLTSWAAGAKPEVASDEWARIVRTLTLLLAPFAPHLAEEMWASLGLEYSVHTQPWPAHDPAALQAAQFTLVIQVDGRVRARRTAPTGIARRAALDLAMESPNVLRFVDESGPRAVVFVPDRLINLLTSSADAQETQAGGRGCDE
jgi:leucyl-tRNA synthetase